MPEIDHGPRFLYGKPPAWEQPQQRRTLRRPWTRSRKLAAVPDAQHPIKTRFDPGPPPPGLGMPEIDHGPRFLYGKPPAWEQPRPGVRKDQALRRLWTRVRLMLTHH